MKRLTISLRLFLTFFSLVLAENLLGQEPAAAALSGSGTENDPYQITSVADWNAFADAVNGGYDYSGEYIKLKENITINVGAGDKMAGVFVEKNHADNRPFNGTFDGNGNTITFNCGTVGSPIDVLACTLFRYTTGVTINNLTVTGTIVSKKKFAAGFIGWYHGSKQSQSFITNCTSHITINCSEIEEGASNKKWDCSTGGFIGQVEEGNVVFTNCVFDGSILKGTQANANRCAGFISYIQSNSVTYTYCTMAGTIDMAQPNNYSTFNRNGKNSFSKTYYITNYGDYKPSPALTTAPTDDIAKIYTKNNTDYYVPGAVITGVATTYSYIEGQPVEITPVVKYYGKTLTRGTDYNIKKNGTLVPTADTPTLDAAGDYTFTIEGAGNYGGSYSTTIHVISYNDWVNVMTQLANDSEGARVVDLSADISAAVNDLTNTALVVRGTVTLNLNGHTINRSLVHVNEDHEVVEDLDHDYNGTGLVIIVESGASLTINGPGTITGGFHKGDAYYNDGGGIYNKGTLILYNVEVVGNKVIKRTDGTDQQNLYSGRGGGIYSGNGSTLIITGGKITDNDSKGGGGGIFSDEANQFDMTNARVAFNVSEDKGGGVRVVISGNKTANLTNCKIMNNSATTNTESKGGGIYMEGKGNNARLNMVNDTLIANTSSLLGGAIYSHQGTIYTEHCHFFNNVSYDAVGITSGENSYGGAVYLYANSTFIINGGSIIGDWSKTNGGGIYVCPGAILKVKGLVVITDNVQMGDDETSSSNNVYLGGTDGVIEVIGQLDPKSVINITPNPDHEGTYVTFDEGTHSADPDDDLSYFVLDINNDDDEYNIILDNSGNVIVYEPYSWGDASTWNGNTMAEDGSTIAEFSGGSSSTPDSNSEVTIRRTLIINTGVIAYAKSISVDEHCRVVIEDGGQLIANSAIAAKVEKKVVAADEDNQTGWYLISSSVANPNIGNSTNLITEIQWDPTYDLYRFNENAELQWENYRADHEGFTTLQNGRGYLYRNANDHKVDIGGTLNVSDINYTLSCSGSELTGFNIIGNPYSHNIAKGEGQAIPNDYLEDNYYVLNTSTGAFELAYDGAIIPPLTGILVQAKSASTLTISKIVASGSKDARAINDDEMWFTINNSEFEDKACVKFKEGHGLNKIEHLNEEAPMLYIHHNDEDFASVDMNPEVKQFNLNFEAKTTGKYTLKVEKTGAYSYLHLIDKVAEKDIDLLEESEYSFIGSSADNAERFIVRLEHSDNVDSSVFAYQSGNEIVVSGEGELQIFDVMGRLVMQKHVSGVEAVEKPMATGVYVLKLNENIQKIIVK